MMNSYDPTLPYVYSFGPKAQKELEKCRCSFVGGNVNCYCRHINLMDDQSPHNSRFSPSGERYTNFAFYDFNAMYCDSERQNMPLTPGLLWEKKGQRFEKSLMIESKSVSFPQMQWLYYMQETEGWDHDGKYVQMEHGYHRGEKRILGYLPDGYIFKNGVHYFYEFLGKKRIFPQFQIKTFLKLLLRMLSSRRLLYTQSSASRRLERKKSLHRSKTPRLGKYWQLTSHA